MQLKFLDFKSCCYVINLELISILFLCSYYNQRKCCYRFRARKMNKNLCVKCVKGQNGDVSNYNVMAKRVNQGWLPLNFFLIFAMSERLVIIKSYYVLNLSLIVTQKADKYSCTMADAWACQLQVVGYWKKITCPREHVFEFTTSLSQNIRGAEPVYYRV